MPKIRDLRRPARDDMTVERLQARLAALHARMNHDGRLVLSVGARPDEPCALVHWTRPGPYAAERWRRVGMGAPAECLRSLELYARARRDGDSATQAAE